MDRGADSEQSSGWGIQTWAGNRSQVKGRAGQSVEAPRQGAGEGHGAVWCTHLHARREEGQAALQEVARLVVLREQGDGHCDAILLGLL